MNIEPNAPIEPDIEKESPAMPLALAFLPSVLVLLFATFQSKHHDPPTVLLMAMCLISVGCCLTSSFMLFSRGTVLGVLGGILFLLLNAVISFLLGCVALASGMKF